jgi:signal transduction histidine kinase
MQAGQTLASTLDYERALQALADLAVPRIACMCAVEILQPDGRVRTLGIAHVDPSRLPLLSRLVADIRGPGDPPPLTQALSVDEPVLIASVTGEWLRANSTDQEDFDAVRELAPTSLMFVPLIARGTRLGVLVLASTRTDRCYGEEDLMLARELGRIASISIDNARLYRQAQDAIGSRDEVLRVVSHDLRNPINTIYMGASFLLDDAAPEVREGTVGRMLEAIVRSTSSANRIIDDLLDVSRIEAGRLAIDLRREPVAPIVLEAIEAHLPSAKAHGIELSFRMDDHLPPILADRERILQVLGNLLTNALKFTPAGGRIEIAAMAEDAAVRWSVEDTGPGVPPDQLPHLFDRFWQARPSDRRGLGLGLAIVNALVEAHGGRVWAESEPHRGTHVRFTVPTVIE